MECEENRIARLLASVEREEQYETVSRPTGAFVRELFAEEVQQEQPDEEEQSDQEEQPEEDVQAAEDVQDEEAPGEQEINLLEQCDFDDLENIPLKTRLTENIITRINGKEAYISKDRKTLWDVQPPGNNQIRTPLRNIIRVRVGCVTRNAKDAITPIEVWNLFFTDTMINNITDHTNTYINENRHKFTRERDAKTTTPIEIRAVLGILYMAGVLKSSHAILEDLYQTDGTGVEYFRCTMSIKRLKFLLRCLRFDEILTRTERTECDKLAPIRDLFNDFIQKCQENFNVSEFVTVDEMLEAFRGRCGFRQFMKSKPAKYGIKVYAAVCAKTFYTLNMEVYVGKQPEGPFSVDNSGKEVVCRMIEPITGTGRNVTVDNFFASIPLCNELQSNHNLTLVGTSRKNKREIPCTFLETKDRPVGSSSFAFKNNCTMVSYKAKKNKDVILISSMHNDDAVDSTDGSPTFGKPEMILFYNCSKGGVDTVDHYKALYSTARICNRWSMRLFYTLLDVAALNSFIVLKKNLQEPEMKRRDFLKQLVFSLSKDYAQYRLSHRNIPKQLKVRMCEIMGIEQHNHRRAPPDDNVTSGRCCLCDWKKNRPSKTRCTQCKFFICREHSSVRCVGCAEEAMEYSSDES